MTETAWLPLALPDAARAIGGYVWLEERLFEVLGSWVPSVPEPEVKLLFAADSYHHAGHASLWRARLPALREMEGESFVLPAGPAVEGAVNGLASAESTIERLVGLYRVVLPRLVAGYQRHLERASAVTDGPTIRVLQLVLADDRADAAEGERLIRSLPDNDDRAAACQARLEELFRAAGGDAEGGAVGGGVGGGGRESNPPDGDHPSQPL